jgi:hypothetical protein
MMPTFGPAAVVALQRALRWPIAWRRDVVFILPDFLLYAGVAFRAPTSSFMRGEGASANVEPGRARSEELSAARAK